MENHTNLKMGINNSKGMKPIKKVLNGKCSYCSKKIDSKYTACFLCNKQKQKRPIIPNCADCGKQKDSIYKYCLDCYPKHCNEWKEKKNVNNNNEL